MNDCTQVDITRFEAITQLIESLAANEYAIASILSAESSKIKKALTIEGITFAQILLINDSIKLMLLRIEELELILVAKLNLFNGEIC